jgi:hypothetical protein
MVPVGTDEAVGVGVAVDVLVGVLPVGVHVGVPLPSKMAV